MGKPEKLLLTGVMLVWAGAWIMSHPPKWFWVAAVLTLIPTAAYAGFRIAMEGEKP